MFTGIIEDTGEIIEFRRKGGGGYVDIKALLSRELKEGDSISVDGACLTVKEVKDRSFVVFLSEETLNRTKFSKTLRKGEFVNLERALKVGDRMGGHFVTGHVDCIGKLKYKRKHGLSEEWVIEFPEEFRKYLVYKGSIAVDGVSLTISALSKKTFKVSLIPFTLNKTTLGRKKSGDLLNLEFDLLAKYIENFLKEK